MIPSRFLPAALGALFLAVVPVPAPGVTLVKLADTVVDPAALTLQDGALYGSGINGEAFQQDFIHTSNGWQYVAYYDGMRNVCLARRHLPGGPWRVIRFADYKFESNDAHNVVSLGICEKDGTIHLAFDHHVSPLHYRISMPGLALHPEDHAWDASLFGPIHSYLETGKDIVVTYPRFWNTPDGGLQCHYRRGTSGNGDNMLVDYHPETGTWSGTRQIDSGKGVFKDESGRSEARNAYPNGYDYDSTGRLQGTWTWREGAAGNNHDLLYAYSNDQGRTWFNDSGQPIQGPASIQTPGLVVEKIGRRQALMNNQAHAIDSHNRVHVVMWSSSVQTTDTNGSGIWGEPSSRRYYHYWREGAGNWHAGVLPWVAGSRPSIFVDDHDNLIMIYNRPSDNGPMASGIYFKEGDLVIATATAASQWQDWRIIAVERGPFINEMLGDPARWKSQRILSIVTQETPKALGDPSRLRVIDYQYLEKSR